MVSQVSQTNIRSFVAVVVTPTIWIYLRPARQSPSLQDTRRRPHVRTSCDNDKKFRQSPRRNLALSVLLLLLLSPSVLYALTVDDEVCSFASVDMEPLLRKGTHYTLSEGHLYRLMRMDQ